MIIRLRLSSKEIVKWTKSTDISKNVLSVLFADDKMLKYLLKLVIIKNQRKC